LDGTSGTDNEIAIFTDSNSIEGDSNLTWDGSTMTVTGDFRVGGTVTAQEFHAEFVSSSIIYESGSTKFGNSYDDYHDFTGSIRVDSTADSHFVGGGFVGIGTTNPESILHTQVSSFSDISIFERAGQTSNLA